ncbi:stimulated by retinoic acid gene 6 protein-like [Ptychodera flava]|uniref:stimulated by retinoic acid gene 6 protein-like n=1 Tax=Ptychodera flava TaxID=63121 RepID=UPI00396A89BC
MATFSFLRKRKRLAQQCCHGRPAIPDSVNMLDEQRDRIGFLFAFGVTAFDVLNIFRGQKYADFGKTDPWVSVWVTALNVIIIVTMYLPMFTSISYANELVGSISALTYCTIVMALSSFVVCDGRPKWWEASGSKSDVLVFVFSVCYLIRHIVVIVQHICGRRKRKNWNSSIFDELHHVVYVRALFRKKKEDAIGDSSKLEDTCLKRLLNAIKYRPVPGFRYSIRILATVIIAATVLYMVCVIELSYFENVRTWRQTIEEKVLNCLVDTDEYSAIALIWYDIVTYLEVILMTSCGVSAFIAVVFLIQTMTTYRNHMLRLYRGDKTFLPKSDGTPSSAMVSCFKYGGYQIGFLLWGFLCLQLTIALLIVFFLFELVFAKKFKWESYFLRQVPTMTSTGIFGALVYMFQLIVSKYVYLQDDGNVIGVDNRRHYHISAFSLLYYNVVLGVFTCISRLLRSLVVGLVFLGRLDHSVLPRNHENLDPGHRAYIGFLKVEEAHTHPVLVTFCHLLQFSRDFKPGTSLDGKDVFNIPSSIDR